MKKVYLVTWFWLLVIGFRAYTQQNSGNGAFDRANRTINKVSSVIAVFQPYLLKARQLYYDGKQLAGDVRNSARNSFGGKRISGNDTTGSNTNMQGYGSGGNSGSNGYSGGSGNNGSSGYSGNNGYSSGDGSNNSGNTPYAVNSGSNGNNGHSGNNNGAYSGANNNSGNSSGTNNGYSGNGASPQNYLPGQNLPVNNPSSINNDGTGNWGNQNNGLYGNCLDVMTGTVIGMGDAAESPTSVDLLFFAPSDGQNTYTLMTPGFAKNNNSAGYMTEHVSDQVLHWSDVNESEVAMTKMTIGQFNQIQNNGQIQSAVRNAQDYAGYYTSVGEKLDGQVLAVKTQMDNREVYALVAVIKQIGTSGGNGYLKIKIKTTGINANTDGQVDANAYLRNGSRN